MDWKHVWPESEGFSRERLEVWRSFLKTHQTEAMMFLSSASVGFEYGETKLLSKIASVPRACWSLLYAVEIEKGVKFDLDKTVEQLGREAIIGATVGEKTCCRTGTRRIFSVSAQSARSAKETTLLTGE